MPDCKLWMRHCDEMSVCRWARVRVRTLAYTPADLAQYAEMNKHILYRPHILEWTVSFKLHTNIFFLYDIFFSISFRLFIVWNGKNYVNALHLLAISVEASNRKLKSTCMNDATNLSSFPQIFLCLQCTQSNRTKPRYLYELSRKSDPNYFRFFFSASVSGSNLMSNAKSRHFVETQNDQWSRYDPSNRHEMNNLVC